LERERIFYEIERERARQELLHPIQLPSKNDDEEIRLMKQYMFFNQMLAVLIEEVGEVGKALQGDPDSILEDELIQVAAVVVRFLEYMK
jgi:hypothetical protein